MNADNKIDLYFDASGEPLGYCSLVKSWGDDEMIVATARMSTDGAFRGWGPTCSSCKTPRSSPDELVCRACGGQGVSPGDEKLLRYLYTKEHMTPFEFCGMTVEMQVPIFILRQIHRHRAAGYNEMSGRYSEMPDIFWSPPPDQIRRQGGSNKQGSIDDFSEEWAEKQALASRLMEASYRASFKIYKDLVSMGVAKEQARAVLPLAQMTRCRMTCNLRMWMHFLGLRLDSHAQPEARELAIAVFTFLKRSFPRTIDIFQDSLAGASFDCSRLLTQQHGGKLAMSKEKGSRGEREVAALVQAWWRRVDASTEIARTPGSGSWGKNSGVRHGFDVYGDLVCSSLSFPFCIEIKRREDWSQYQLSSDTPSGNVWVWWQQCQSDAKAAGKIPMLWMRKNKQPWHVLLPHDLALLSFSESGEHYYKPFADTVHPFIKMRRSQLSRITYGEIAPHVWFAAPIVSLDPVLFLGCVAGGVNGYPRGDGPL